MDVFIDLQNVIIGGLSTFHDVFNVTCRSTEQPHNNCGICKACLVNQQLHFSKEWWSRSGDLTRRRFLLALISRIRPELLEHLAQILKPFVESKDFTYARNKFLPSSVHDRFGTSGDRCLDPSKVHEDSVIILNWFKSQDKYTQCSFLLTILQWCEYHLIFAAAMTIISIQEIDCKLKLPSL
ncbi:unnamed protein product [Didymodactylos carnosus]|uniref:Uncharacterized protein n=1 Tax=Didymodactylos carnosus TaxID=1234261 RepID=A0A8S2F6U8_9BILA|nr:unnamed protein product [Didymodactylos carnosus]CAF4158242.1 unnamed protein product [Didymodactylos carnosus]